MTDLLLDPGVQSKWTLPSILTGWPHRKHIITHNEVRNVVRSPWPGCAIQPSSGTTIWNKAWSDEHVRPQEDIGKVSSGNTDSIWGGLKQEKRTLGLVLGQRMRACRSGDWQTVSVKSWIDVLILVGCAVALPVSATQLCSCRAEQHWQKRQCMGWLCANKTLFIRAGCRRLALVCPVLPGVANLCNLMRSDDLRWNRYNKKRK